MACQACDDTGFVIVERDGRELADRCECQAEALDPLVLAGLPPLERTFTVAGLTPAAREAFDLATAVLARGESVVLVGPVGRGKTGIAACLARAAGESRRSIAWRHLATWLRDIRASYERRDDDDMPRPTEAQLLAEIAHVELLVIDDVGAEKPSEWACSMFGQLVSGRDSSEKSTVYTTNLPIDPARDKTGREVPSIESVYGDRVASRFRRCARIVLAAGADRRAMVR